MLVYRSTLFEESSRPMSTSEIGSYPSTGATSRKEKKKQAKEERDRLKQVEKKKRRLEKALATATAIRLELEKKKQRRKEEEQRLDAEGAALAESVALQVLVDEEVISLSDDTCKVLSSSEASASDGKLQTSVVSDGNDKEVILCREDVQVNKLVCCSGRGFYSNPRDKIAFSSERAKAAELAAGIAAAQAVAALKIAEEARAEAEAAKKAAEAAICQVLDQREVSNSGFDQAVMGSPSNAEMERDELKARLAETERRLKEKTRRVFHLEQSLEDMSRYLLHWKSAHPQSNVGFQLEEEISERGSTNLRESSHGASNH